MARYTSEVVKAAVAVQRQSIALLKTKLGTRRHHVVHKHGSRYGCPTITRRRKTVKDIHREMGDGYFRRAFRMSIFNFARFFEDIRDDLRRVMNENDPVHCVNGRIPLSSRVALALLFFAGGDAYDLSCLWGISHTEVFNSVDYVTDAINTSDNFKLQYLPLP